ncbi:MAG: metallophosphoesterase [Lewinellaceae bacterium]|nr:metallophosphoesterase [Lewinellaceae bacterium]
MKRNAYAVTILFVLLLVTGSSAQTIIRGPYLQSGTPSGMTIKWRTDVPTSTRLWYGSSPSSLPYTNTVNGTRTDHQVTISGLPANTTFFYAVGNSSGQLTLPSSNHYFRTSPNPGATQTVRAWVLGDCGTSNQNQRAVRDAFYNYIGASRIDLMLLLGDNAYESGTDEEFQTALFENMYEAKLINTVLWPAIGNHETITADSPTQSGPYYDIFTLPTNGEAGGTPSGTEAYYSYDYGNIHFVVLDSDDTDRSPGSPMLTWLANDLANTTMHWKVAYFHHPPYSTNGSDLSTQQTQVRQNFLPVLEAHGVDLVLVGHVHNYQRSFLINGHYGLSSTWDPATMGLNLGDGRLNGNGAYTKTAGTGPSSKGTVYIVTGSAGKKGNIDVTHPVMFSSIPELGSMLIEVTGNQMDLKFIRENGNVQDYFTIIKQGLVGSPPTVSVTAPANGTNYTSPQTITINANASDSDGSISRVEFFVNNVPIGYDNQAPYSINYFIPEENEYNIYAVARDNANNTTQSAVVRVTLGPVSTCSRVSTGSDDAEERPSGSVSLTSGDLELVNDPGLGNQVVGLRFNGLNIPPGVLIREARLQFTTDEALNENPCALTIYGQDADNAATFTSAKWNVSSRPRTSATASWQPADWLTVGGAGLAQRTIDLSSIIQEIIDRPGYTINSSIALIIEGIGRRTAESFEGAALKAPELCIQYSFSFPDCPALGADIGDPCNDGDNTTTNDMIDADCNCTGIPTACNGIGDDDGDGICADVDCDDDDPGITRYIGAPCDDNNPATINDVIDANCNCAGTFNDCLASGDADGDGVCANEDCDDNDPNITSVAGDPCDDGDNTTFDDIYDANCNCAGLPTACTGIGDADGDGICADVDCDDNNPNNTNHPGVACNDGNPNTIGETIQSDCSCGGGAPVPVSSCATVAASSDDAEERRSSGAVSLNSSDLELATDNFSQSVGMRFNGFNIPQGAFITNAYIQFTVDETLNSDPCDLSITGHASDNAPTFTGTGFNVSSRPRTASSVNWSPPQWLVVGQAGPAQRTPDIASVIQEIVNRSGYTSGSSIALIIEGTGRRTAEAADAPAGAPRLCVEYLATPPAYDCPALSANIGTPCNDGDNTTVNDVVTANCNCAGTPTACTGIGDADGDGVCANVDCNDNNPGITHQPGTACDDGNPATVNDAYDANCNCTGTLNSCPGIGDMDGDGICADVDCNDNNPSITTKPGDPCNDGNPNTVGETIQADCTCGGGNSTPALSCSRVNTSSDDAEQQGGPTDLSSSDLELTTDPNLGNQTIGMRFNGLNLPQGAVITNAYIQFTVDENVNDNPCTIQIFGQAADNPATFAATSANITSRPRTTANVTWSPPSWLVVGQAEAAQRTPNIAPVIQEIVNRSGFTTASPIVIIMDGTGRRTAEAYDGAPTQAPQLCVEYLAPAQLRQGNTPNGVAVESDAAEGPGTSIGPLSVHPNPTSGQLLVQFNSLSEGTARLQVRSLSGQIVLLDKYEVRLGENTVIWNDLPFPDGIYFLQLFMDGATMPAKFVIQSH